jgi:phage-related protein
MPWGVHYFIMGNIIAFLLLLWVHVVLLKTFLGIFIPSLRKASTTSAILGIFRLMGLIVGGIFKVLKGIISIFFQLVKGIVTLFFQLVKGLFILIFKLISGLGMTLLLLMKILPKLLHGLLIVGIYTLVFLRRALIKRK